MDGGSITAFKDGYVSLILGPMFSGKSSELISIKRKWESIDEKIFVINHSFDELRWKKGGTNEGGTNGMNGTNGTEIPPSPTLRSHSKESVDADISVSHLLDPDHNVFSNPEYRRAKIIIIDEGQFFDDIVQFVKDATSIDKKIIIISALDGDKDQKIFPVIAKLIPYCDDIYKKHSLCQICKDGTKASFSISRAQLQTSSITSTSDDTPFISPGGSESYLTICRKCLNKYTKN